VTADGLDPQFIARLEWAEAAGLLDLYRASAEAANGIGAHALELDGVAIGAIDVIDTGFFNRALGLGSDRPAVADDVAAISEAFRSLARRESLIQVPNEVTTPDLAAWLEAAGYSRGRNWVKLWRGLDGTLPEPASDLHVEQIGPEHGADFTDVVIEAMGMPGSVGPMVPPVIGRQGWLHYAAFDGDTLVSTAAMFVDGETAWLGFGATREAARGRGGQSALFARRLRDARALGCTLAVTETGEETAEFPVNHSYRNMLRSGFTLAYARPNWRRVEA
jgi:hypothetical protein